MSGALGLLSGCRYRTPRGCLPDTRLRLRQIHLCRLRPQEIVLPMSSQHRSRQSGLSPCVSRYPLPRLPIRAVLRPWHEATPDALPSPLLSGRSRPRQAAPRLAPRRRGRPPRGAGDASRAAAGGRGALGGTKACAGVACPKDWRSNAFEFPILITRTVHTRRARCTPPTTISPSVQCGGPDDRVSAPVLHPDTAVKHRPQTAEKWRETRR